MSRASLEISDSDEAVVWNIINLLLSLFPSLLINGEVESSKKHLSACKAFLIHEVLGQQMLRHASRETVVCDFSTVQLAARVTDWDVRNPSSDPYSGMQFAGCFGPASIFQYNLPHRIVMNVTWRGAMYIALSSLEEGWDKTDSHTYTHIPRHIINCVSTGT